jgi:hypothetical protein
MNKTASIFSLFCGIAMLVTWGVLLGTGQVTELKTSPFQAIALLAAEILTAIALIAGGYGLLRKRLWGLRVDLAALGMLLYCAIYSIGFFGQQGILPAAIFFAAVVILAALFSGKFILSSN